MQSSPHSRASWQRCLRHVALFAWAGAVQAQNASTPGTVSVPYPTLEHISIEWAIAGDDDLDGVVQVRYRPQGESLWRAALPLRRVPAGSNQGFSWTNRHSGSVFGLQPGTAYELELTLSDPDGGNSVQTLPAGTRAVPVPMPGAPQIAVTPATLATALAAAMPGDILVLQPDNYAGFTVGRSGTPAAPLVLRGMPGAVINGEVGLFGRADVQLESLTVNGRIRFNGSNRIAITRCTVNASATQFNGDGIVSYLRSENAYIADNIVNGTTVWNEAALGASGANRGEGILVTGPGHVIRNNRVRGFRDNLSLLEDGEAVEQYSIDFIENELSEAADDAIEADFCFHNCRSVRNRVTNAFIAFSSQPALGGPNWFVRNAAYNVVHVAFKLYRGSSGDVLLHNTVVKNGDALGIYAGVPVSRLTTRNNLLIGGAGGSYNGFSSGSGRVADIFDLVGANASLDYDAFGSNLGTFTGRLAGATFNSLAQMRMNTGEANAIETSLAAFAQAPAFPSQPLSSYAAVDLRTAAGSSVRDGALLLANLNEGFDGTGPDHGAYEGARALPPYGPRPLAVPGLVFADGFE